MYKAVAILYLFCFSCYILFTRSPDYFDSKFIKGIVVQQTSKSKTLRYEVDSTIYKTSLNGWGSGALKDKDIVRVIYNPSLPSEASVYSFFLYWLKLPELLFSAFGFLILFFAAVFINGRQPEYYYSKEELRKKRKYDD